MATYFTAKNEDAAVALIPGPDDDETLVSPVPPVGEAFAALIELVWGQSIGDLDGEQQYVLVDLEGGSRTLVRLGSRLQDTIADLPEDLMQALAVPWSEAPAMSGVDVDAVDFVTDLQHLCRNARAIDGRVYATQGF